MAYSFRDCQSSIQTPKTERQFAGGAEREPQINPVDSGPAEPGQFRPALLICAFSNEKRAYANCPQIYGF